MFSKSTLEELLAEQKQTNVVLLEISNKLTELSTTLSNHVQGEENGIHDILANLPHGVLSPTNITTTTTKVPDKGIPQLNGNLRGAKYALVVVRTGAIEYFGNLAKIAERIGSSYSGVRTSLDSGNTFKGKYLINSIAPTTQDHRDYKSKKNNSNSDSGFVVTD